MATAYVTHPDTLAHEMGPHHPEQPARLTAITSALARTGMHAALQHHEAPLAEEAWLLRVHDASYLRAIEAVVTSQGYVHLDPDTAMNPHSLVAARRAARAVMAAVDAVMAGQVGKAFCAVRPPGHHACRARTSQVRNLL